ITCARLVFQTRDALVTRTHGSPKTQNIKDAIAHAESGKPLARGATQQMPAVRKQRAIAHRLPIVRLLPWPPGFNAGREVAVADLCQASRSEAATFSLCNQAF